MDVFQKFIIEDGNLIIAKCTYHKQLAINKNNVIGGGWWRRAENQPNDFILYGSSDDFGKAEFEDIKKCILNGNVFTNKYSDNSIVNKYNFYYDNYHEIVKIN